MAVTVDFVPFATADGANVTSQSDYIAESTTGTGFISGVASSADCNKAWRQGTFQAAVLANFVSDQLTASVLDDGNLSGAVTNLTDAITALIASNLTAYATIAYASNASNLASGTIASARLPGTIAASTTGNAATATLAAGVTLSALTANTNYNISLAISPTSVGYSSSASCLFNPSTGALDIGGSITSAGYYIGSDMQLKENVTRLDEDGSLAFVCSLEGFTHNYIKDPDVRRVGLSAQAIKAVRPEAVSVSENGILQREVGGMDPDFVMSIRALTRRIAALEARLARKEGGP